MSSADRIRSLRAASNAALEGGDVEGFMASIDADYVGTAGDGGHIRSRDELRELVSAVVGGEPRTGFVRTPAEVEVAAAGGRALENGRWEGYTLRGGVPQTTESGRYTAYWRRTGGRWMIHAEIFVTLPDGAPR